MTEADAWVRLRRVQATEQEIEGHQPEGPGCLVGCMMVAAAAGTFLASQDLPISATITAVLTVLAGGTYEVIRRRHNVLVEGERQEGGLLEVESHNAPLFHGRSKWAKSLLFDLGQGRCLPMHYPFGEALYELRFGIVDDATGSILEKDTVDYEDVILLLRERVTIRWFEKSGHIASVRVGGALRYLDSEVPADLAEVFHQFQAGHVGLVDGLEVDADSGEPRLRETSELWAFPEQGYVHRFPGRSPIPAPSRLAEPTLEVATGDVMRCTIRGGVFAMVYWYGSAILLIRAAQDRALALANCWDDDLPLEVHGQSARFVYGDAALANDCVTLEYAEDSGDLRCYAVKGARLAVDQSRMGPDLGRSRATPKRTVTWIDGLDVSERHWIDASLECMAQAFD